MVRPSSVLILIICERVMLVLVLCLVISTIVLYRDVSECGVLGSRAILRSEWRGVRSEIFTPARQGLRGVGIRAFHPHPNPLPQGRGGMYSWFSPPYRVRGRLSPQPSHAKAHLRPVKGEGACWLSIKQHSYIYLPFSADSAGKRWGMWGRWRRCKVYVGQFSRSEWRGVRSESLPDPPR